MRTLRREAATSERRSVPAMRSNPPTRRSRHSSNGDSSLPIIPILIGVIVLGFVIGAGLSLAGRHDIPVVAIASPSPGNASVTLAPVTPAPTERPTPQPTDAPTEKPTRAPASLAPASESPSAKASRATQRPIPPAKPAVASEGTSAATAAATAQRAASPATAAAVVAQPSSAAGVPVDTPTSPAAPLPPRTGAQADVAFEALSAAVVRQYLEAVKRGDQDSAYAALGASPGAKGASLSEAALIDSRTRVGRIDAHAAANDNALVSVQLQTPSGPYYGQYTVHKTDTGAAVIVAHSIVKP